MMADVADVFTTNSSQTKAERKRRFEGIEASDGAVAFSSVSAAASGQQNMSMAQEKEVTRTTSTTQIEVEEVRGGVDSYAISSFAIPLLDDMWEHIFTFLPNKECFVCCTRVGRDWCDIIRATACRSVPVTIWSSASAVEFLSSTTAIRHLSAIEIYCSRTVDDIFPISLDQFTQINSSLKHLTSLQIDLDYHIPSIEAVFIAPTLKELFVSYDTYNKRCQNLVEEHLSVRASLNESIAYGEQLAQRALDLMTELIAASSDPQLLQETLAGRMAELKANGVECKNEFQRRFQLMTRLSEQIEQHATANGEGSVAPPTLVQVHDP